MYASALRDPLDRRVSLGETAFILNHQGENIEVVLSGINEENRENRKEGFYYASWDLRRITPESLDDLSNNEIISLVKEALNVYGLDGIESKDDVALENIITKFKF